MGQSDDKTPNRRDFEYEELMLRRRLLFRLLKDFDFNAPRHRYGYVSETGFAVFDRQEQQPVCFVPTSQVVQPAPTPY